VTLSPQEGRGMKKRQLHFKSGLAMFALTTFLCVVQPARAQSAPSQDYRPVQDPDANRQELLHFSEFLNSHPEITDQLRRDPSLVNNEEYVKNHPALQTYLRDHPDMSQQIKQDPNAVMREADRLDRRDDNRGRNDANRRELDNFNHFLDGHVEIGEQLRKDPSLVDNGQFVKNHPALQTYLQDHPGVREAIKEDPNGFMHAEDRMDVRDDQRNREELANFNRFLDSHREIAEQLRRDPSLAENPQFVKNHPAFQTYLQDHPGVRSGLQKDPNAFMIAENRYDHGDDATNRDHHDDLMDHDTYHRRFGEFLSNHPDLSQQIAKDPTLCSNRQFLDSHRELQAYLSANPDVQKELMSNPQEFVKSSQQFTVNLKPTTKTPPPNPKPNQ
jgi:hypothetical protein